jgi:hypothetical protein
MMARGAPNTSRTQTAKKIATGSLRLQMGCSHTLAAAQRENFQFNDGGAVR